MSSIGPGAPGDGSRDRVPATIGFVASNSDAINHHADACVWDSGTGTGYLIDFTFTNALAAKASGNDSDWRPRQGW